MNDKKKEFWDQLSRPVIKDEDIQEVADRDFIIRLDEKLFSDQLDKVAKRLNVTLEDVHVKLDQMHLTKITSELEQFFKAMPDDPRNTPSGFKEIVDGHLLMNRANKSK